MSLQPFTLFSFNISACGFVLVGPKKIIIMLLVAMTTKSHRQVCYWYVILVVTVVVATNDITAVDMTTVGSASSSQHNLTLVLLTPLDGNLGFERNAAASTLALRQAQADGLLSDMHITYVEVFVSLMFLSITTIMPYRPLMAMTHGRQNVLAVIATFQFAIVMNNLHWQHFKRHCGRK